MPHNEDPKNHPLLSEAERIRIQANNQRVSQWIQKLPRSSEDLPTVKIKGVSPEGSDRKQFMELQKEANKPLTKVGAGFEAFGMSMLALSKYTYVFAIALLIAGAVGIAISPLLGVGLVAGVIAAGVIAGIVTHRDSLVKAREMNQHIKNAQQIDTKINEVNELIRAELFKQNKLKDKARNLGIDISQIENEQIKHANQGINNFLPKFEKSKTHKAEKLVERILSIVGLLGISIGAVGCVIAAGAWFAGVNVLQAGLVTGLVAMTGLAPMVAIPIVVAAVAIIFAALLINKYKFKTPLKYGHKNIAKNSLQHELEYSKAETKLSRLQQVNKELQGEIRLAEAESLQPETFTKGGVRNLYSTPSLSQSSNEIEGLTNASKSSLTPTPSPNPGRK